LIFKAETPADADVQINLAAGVRDRLKWTKRLPGM
jgi:hypothetical protein